jgi:small subunit ribosomal protein S18
MPKPRRKLPPKKKILKNAVCYFCEKKIDPDYLDYETLRKFVSDRSRIVSRGRSGICAKHQRKLAIAVKRARHLGLIGFRTAI